MNPTIFHKKIAALRRFCNARATTADRDDLYCVAIERSLDSDSGTVPLSVAFGHVGCDMAAIVLGGHAYVF